MDIVEPVRYLYAADLRIDKPLALGEGGSVIAPRARDAAYEATRRLVDFALSSGVDFVLLRGELCDAHCGAGAMIFLAEQTTRLSKAGIPCHILNEGAALDAVWLAEFPNGVKWLRGSSEDAGIVTCANREIPLAPILASAPPPLQGLCPDESGPKGAWLVFLPGLPDGGEPEREFVELDALRWERCEMDVTQLETEEDLTAFWRTVKDGFRERERDRESAKRPVLLHLKLTGVMKERSLFYGEGFTRDPGVLMKKLNADEVNRKNFVLIDSLEDDTIQPLPQTGAEAGGKNGINSIKSDFWSEVAAFKSGIDLRVGLFEALKERGDLKRILSTDAAPVLENMSESDVESLLKESCDMANYWLFKDTERPK